VTPLKVIATSLAGLLLLPVLVIGAVAGGFDNGASATGDTRTFTGDASELVAAVLSDAAIRLTPAARGDVEASGVDPRVLEVLLALAQSHELAPVGPLITGHSNFVKGTTRVSNHVYGRAVDILGVDGEPVSPWNAAARDVMEQALSLPSPLTPDEVGGPWILSVGNRSSFTTADHQNHIHIGYEHD